MSKLKTTVAAPILVLVVFLLLRLTNLIDLSELAHRDNIFLSVVVIQLVIFALPGIFYCRLKPTGYLSKLRFRPFSFNKIYFTVLSLGVMCVGSILINYFLNTTVSITESSTVSESYFLGGASDAKSAVFIILALCVIPAICEEFIFRSIILTEYREATGNSILAILVSAFLFAMTHFSLSGFLSIFFAGIILAFCAFATESVFAPIIIHIGYNLVSVFLGNEIVRFITNISVPTVFVFVLITLFLVLCVLLFAEGERLYYNRGVGGEKCQLPVGGNFSKEAINVISSPTFIACIIFFIISLVGLD